MNIIDAHHHIWRMADLHWLQGPEQPRIFGAYDAIRRDYLIEEYLDDLGGTTAVTLTSAIDAGPRPPQQLVARVAGRVLATASRQMLSGLDEHLREVAA